MLGRQTRKPFPTSTTPHAPAALIHTDTCGPFTSSIFGNVYVQTYVEHHSRHMRAYFLPNKQSSSSLDCFKDYRAFVEKQTGQDVKTIRSDRGGEFVSREFDNYLAEEGIARQLTIRETPEQNGVAERTNRTIEERVRAILASSNLPLNLWEEIWDAAVYLYNRSPHSATGELPLTRLLHSEPPSVAHLRILGSIAYAHVQKHARAYKLGSHRAETVV